MRMSSMDVFSEMIPPNACGPWDRGGEHLLSLFAHVTLRYVSTRTHALLSL